MKLKIGFCILFLVLVGHVRLQAQDSNFYSISTDRPSFGTSAYVLSQGIFQIETGFQFTSVNSSIAGNVAPGLKFEIFNYSNTVLRFGIADRIELRFTQNLSSARFRLNGETTDTYKTFFSPTAIGAKINLVRDSESMPDISFLANVGGQVFSNDGSGSFMDATILLTSSVFDAFNVDLNFGTAWLNGLSTLSYQYAFGLSRSISQKFGVYIESYGIIPEDGRLEEHNLNGGFNYLLNNDTQLDFYGGTGFSQFSPNIFFGLGFSKRLK